MHTQTGACPKCGAPIYAPYMWHSILPPPPEYTCGCHSMPYVTTSATSASNIQVKTR